MFVSGLECAGDDKFCGWTIAFGFEQNRVDFLVLEGGRELPANNLFQAVKGWFFFLTYEPRPESTTVYEPESSRNRCLEEYSNELLLELAFQNGPRRESSHNGMNGELVQSGARSNTSTQRNHATCRAAITMRS